MAAALLAMGGSALLWAAPAGADSSSGSSGSSDSSGATTGPTTSLGGYTLTASGSGLSVYYEQPNFPIPATPTLEADVGYSDTAFNAGPTGTANASTVWPGSVVAGGGSQLQLLLGPYLQEYCGAPCANIPIPNFGNWPIDAATNYPQGPDTDNNDNGPSTMEASSTASGSTANASLSTIGGTGTRALSAGMFTAQTVASTSQSTIDNTGNALAEATSTVQDVDIAGGLIDIGQVTSTASSSSDGNQATLSGSSAATGVTVAGEAVTVDSNGVHAALTSAVSGVAPAGSLNPFGTLLPNVNQVLQTAGITMTLTNPTDTVDGPSGERELDGLQVTMNLTTFDKNFSSLVAMLPSQLKSGLYMLPLPLPDEQIVTLDIGWVNVNAAASPPFNLTLPSLDTGGSTPLSSATGTLGTTLPTSTGTSSFTTPSASTGTTPATTPGATAPLATAPVALFKGIGSGLIALGVILGAILAFFLIRTEAAVGAIGSGAACVGEDRRPIG